MVLPRVIHFLPVVMKQECLKDRGKEGRREGEGSGCTLANASEISAEAKAVFAQNPTNNSRRFPVALTPNLFGTVASI